MAPENKPIDNPEVEKPALMTLAELGEEASKEIAHLKELNDAELASSSEEERRSINAERQKILEWFKLQLGEGEPFDQKVAVIEHGIKSFGLAAKTAEKAKDLLYFGIINKIIPSSDQIDLNTAKKETPVEDFAEVASKKIARLIEIEEDKTTYKTISDDEKKSIGKEIEGIWEFFRQELGGDEEQRDRKIDVINRYIESKKSEFDKGIIDLFRQQVAAPIHQEILGEKTKEKARESSSEQPSSNKTNVDANATSMIEQQVPESRLGELAYYKILELGLLETGSPTANKISTNEERKEVFEWFDSHLGKYEVFDERRAIIEKYLAEVQMAPADKSNPLTKRLLMDILQEQIIKPYQKKLELEKQEAREWLKEAAERGVVVQGISRGDRRSDLDGNTFVALLKRAHAVTKDEQVHYIVHADLDKYLAGKINEDGSVIKRKPGAPPLKPRNIGVMGDISPEEVPGLDDRQQKDSLAGLITPEGGMIFFDHHGGESDPNSGSATKKLYNWLLDIGALTKAEAEREGWDKIVAFVDAQDNKNYYTEGEKFDLEGTAYNAFGYTKTPFGQFDPKLKLADGTMGGYDPRFVELMKLTGGNPAKLERLIDGSSVLKIPLEYLKAAGFGDPEKLIKETHESMHKAREIIQQLRREKLIVTNSDGQEIFVDLRKRDAWGKKIPGRLENLGVDPSDLLMSEGIYTHVICGADRDDYAESLMIFTHDPLMLNGKGEERSGRLAELTKSLGGDIGRNSFYFYKHQENRLGIDDRVKLASVLERLGISNYGETVEQKDEKGCVPACFVNIAKYVFGEKADGIEDWLISRLGKDFKEGVGTNISSAKELAKRLSYTAFQYDNFNDLRKELEAGIEKGGKGRGAIMWVNGHAVSIYLKKNFASGKLEIVYRDPRQNADHSHPSIEVVEYTEENLEKFLSRGRKNGEKPYSHILVIGAEGAKSVAGGDKSIEDALSKLPLVEQVREEHKLSLDVRIEQLLNRYRPKVDFSKIKGEWYQRIPYLSIALGQYLPKEIEQEYNQALKKAYEWEINNLLNNEEIKGKFLADNPDVAEWDLVTIGEDSAKKYHPEYEKILQIQIDALEMRYLSECADIAEQTENLKASEREYVDRVNLRLDGLEHALDYFGPAGLNNEQRGEYLDIQELKLQSPLTTEKMAGVWGDRSDLTTKYYLLADGLPEELRQDEYEANRWWLFRSMRQDVFGEQGIVKIRENLMATNLREFDQDNESALPGLGDAIKAMSASDKKIFDGLREELAGNHFYYQQLNHGAIWDKFDYADGSLMVEQAREFIELQRQQTEAYYQFISISSLIRLLVKNQAETRAIELEEPEEPKEPKVA